MILAQAKLSLLHQLLKMREYVEDNFTEIDEVNAQKALEQLRWAWSALERRKKHV